jgi:hypothetical protein
LFPRGFPESFHHAHLYLTTPGFPRESPGITPLYNNRGFKTMKQETILFSNPRLVLKDGKLQVQTPAKNREERK